MLKSVKPQLDLGGRYRVERCPDGDRHLVSPMLRDGGSPELVGKFRDLAELLNAAIDADRRR